MSQVDRPRTFVGAGATFSRSVEAKEKADQWNAAHTVGTPVIYWPLGFLSAARIGRTRDVARSRDLRSGDGRLTDVPEFVAEVYVDGYGGPISLGFVALITPDNMRGVLRLEVSGVIEIVLDAPGGLLPVDAELAETLLPLLRPLKLAIAAAHQKGR